MPSNNRPSQGDLHLWHNKRQLYCQLANEYEEKTNEYEVKFSIEHEDCTTTNKTDIIKTRKSLEVLLEKAEQINKCIELATEPDEEPTELQEGEKLEKQIRDALTVIERVLQEQEINETPIKQTEPPQQVQNVQQDAIQNQLLQFMDKQMQLQREQMEKSDRHMIMMHEQLQAQKQSADTVANEQKRAADVQIQLMREQLQKQ